MAKNTVLNEDILKRKKLILRNLQEVLGEENLTKKLLSEKSINVYWGTAPTGRPHIGYLVPMQKIADLLNAKIRVTILFADLHAFLDNLKCSFDLLKNRVYYYEHLIKALLTALDVSIEKLVFVKGSAYQLSMEYTQTLLQLCSIISQRDALKAGAEVVKQVENPLLSGILYPILQALDEEFLKVDGQFGGIDQRKIFILAEEQMPKLKFPKRFHLMNPMIPGLTGSKMSSSEENTKIDLLDTPEDIERKINKAVCKKKSETNSDEQNGVLLFFKFVIFPTIQKENNITDETDGTKFVLIKEKKYETFGALENDFEKEIIKEKDLKSYLTVFLKNILEKVQKRCNNSEFESISKKAYPQNSVAKTELENVLNLDEVMLDEKENSYYERFLNGMQCLYPNPLKRAIKNSKKIQILYRCSIKGRVNLLHIFALLQLKKLLNMYDCNCTILISDLGAFLDNEKCPWLALEARATYYELVLKEIMKAINLEKVEIVHSKSYEYQEDYVMNFYKAISTVTKKETALVSGNAIACNLCPIYFFLDLYHYKKSIDLLLIGKNQINFIHLAKKIEKNLNYPLRLPSVAILPELLGMDGKRMSSTQQEYLLEPFDTKKKTEKKIKKTFCESGNLENNVVLNLAKLVIFPLLQTKNNYVEETSTFTIERHVENGGDLNVRTYKELEENFISFNLHPADLKSVVSSKITDLFNKICNNIKCDEILRKAFPPTKKIK